MKHEEFISSLEDTLIAIQKNLFSKAQDFQKENKREIDKREELYEYFTAKNSSKPEIHGGFALIHWDRNPKWEEQLKNDLKVTIRCIPEGVSVPGTCLFSGQASPGRVVVAKSY